MHVHADGTQHEHTQDADGTSRVGVLHGPYGELVWPALAGAALAGGFLLARRESDFAHTAAYVSYGIAYAAGGWEATRDGLRQLAKARLDIDFLMVIAAIGAAAVGEFFEGALLLFLFSLGHGLEHLALSRARSAVTALARLAPKTARLRAPDGRERDTSGRNHGR